MSQQQTVLRVARNQSVSAIENYEYLDLYSDIPIKINKSIAEIEDISKRNSDYSIGLSLPGSKTNNRFFESYFNVDSVSLYFNATTSVQCNVLIDEGLVFTGYLRLNKVSVMNSKVEYDVTLYSTIGDLFGQIGNNLLVDLDFEDTEYTFNHIFSNDKVGELWTQSNFFRNSEYTYPYFYPIIHNGYNYESISGATLPNFTGATEDQTRLYTTTSPLSGFTGTTQAYAAGVQEYHINSPTFVLRDNQLKPALNIWSLIQLMFKTYGYEISGNFFNTPWMKGLYLYGYFSSEGTKFSYKLNNIESLPLEGVDVTFLKTGISGYTGNAIVTKRGAGIPCYCLDDIPNVSLRWTSPTFTQNYTIPAGTSGVTQTVTGKTFSETLSTSTYVPKGATSNLRYFPKAVGTTVAYNDGDFIDFSLVIDQNIKQIDLLSSIAKKFNLVFIPDPDFPNKIIIEPFDYFMGTGQIYDWTPKLSYDKGFTVEPALNYLDSNYTFTDLEDGDEGNRIFKIQNNRIYGQNNVYNPTSYKSTTGKTDTIFSPELIRKWDNNIGLPLGLNYSASSEQSTFDNQVRWLYKGIKTKPKIFFWLMGLNPFIDSVGEVFDYYFGGVNTYTIKTLPSTGTTSRNEYALIPTISHTMPMGLSDSDKINNDTLCVLFNSELPTDVGVQTFNTYTENDIYNKFYSNRITNIYDPNTRFINGYFDLKYSDVKNLKWNDIIKIQEQYFIINKLSEYNLTNRELTKVELLQFNVNPQIYPIRYFKYTYCDNPSVCFKIKTDFTNPNLRESNYMWSIWYDNQVGTLTNQTTNFTSTFRYFDIITLKEYYVAYTMTEITEDEYNTNTCFDYYTCDTLIKELYRINGVVYMFGTNWFNSGFTKTGVNVWNNCTDFTATKNANGINLGSSTFYGISPCLPTPTPTPTATPTPTPTLPGPTPTPTLLPPEFRKTVYGAIGGDSKTLDRSLNSGVSFTYDIATLPAANYGDIATDYTSKYVMILGDYYGIQQSSDSGSTFTTIANIGSNWINIDMTNDGVRRLISNNSNLYISYNTGVTYNILPTTGITFPVNSKLSGFSNVIVLTNSTYIYVSTDFGSTFNIRYTMRVNEIVRKITTSDNGQFISVMTYIGNNLYSIRSGDYGATFSIVTLPTLINHSTNQSLWIDFGMSQSGQYQYTTIENSGLFTSTDYGLTFNYTNTPAQDSALGIWVAGNNKNLILGKYGPPFDAYGTYLSFNGGSTWQGMSPYGNAIYYLIIAPEQATPPFTLPPTPTPLPTATPSPTPTITPTPLPLPTGSLFYYDPGNIASYPGSGSVLYDLSGNGRNANINAGINWVSGSAAYFDLNGNDNNSITGTTLNQTYTSWSMWMGVYRNYQGDIGGYDGFMYERTGANNGNGLGTFALSNRLDISVNNGTEIVEPSPGTMTTGSWMFIAGAVDNTTYTSQVYSSGSVSPFLSGSKAAGSSNFDNAIVLGEDKEAGVDRTMDGRIGPALMYNRKLSTTELTQINNFFKTRYGI